MGKYPSSSRDVITRITNSKYDCANVKVILDLSQKLALGCFAAIMIVMLFKEQFKLLSLSPKIANGRFRVFCRLSYYFFKKS